MGARFGVALALGVLWSSAARAEGPPHEAQVLLDWSRGPGAETCLSSDEAAREVERLLARRVFGTVGTERRLVVSIERTEVPPGYRANMTLFAASGAPLGSREIEIEADRCEQATEAFTLALSIMADLPRTPEESGPPPVVPSEQPRPRSPPPPRPPSHLRLGVGIAALMETGTRVAPGGHLVALFEPIHFVPVMAGVLSTVRAHDTSPSRSAWLSSTQVEAGVCLPPWRRGAFGVLGCLGPQATVRYGWGAGFREARSGVAAAFGGVARAYVHYRLGSSVELFGTIAVAVSPERLAVTYTDGTGARRTAFETSTVIPSLSFGAAFVESLGTGPRRLH